MAMCALAIQVRFVLNNSDEVSEDRRVKLQGTTIHFGNLLGVKHCIAQARVAYTTNGIAAPSEEQIEAFKAAFTFR
jgi:hypothetical protein